MNRHKVLIVHYSRSGHTREVAKQLAQQIDCDNLEITCVETYPLGIWGFQKALISSLFKGIPQIKFPQINLTKFDTVIIGTPIWAGRISSPMRSFLLSHGNKIKQLAVFTTQAGEVNKESIRQQISQLYGKEPSLFVSFTEKDIKNNLLKKGLKDFVEGLNLTTSRSDRRAEFTANL